MASWKVRALHALGQQSRGKAAREFSAASTAVEDAQRTVLNAILARNHATEYARSHGLRATMEFKDFTNALPVLTPTALQPLVNRMLAGERNILTADAPVYYVRTTGSTGEPKHVPITPSYRVEFQKTVHVALWHLYRRFPEAFHSRALYAVGSCKVAVAPDGNDIGTMSGFNFTQMPALVRAVYAWPYELFDVKDLRSRTYLALVLASLGDPSLIAGIFPAPIVYMLRDLEVMAPQLAGTLRTGRLPDHLQLSDGQRAFFASRVHASPTAAARMDAAAGAPVEHKVALAWPSLRLVYCWNTATAALYLPELKRRLGPGVAVRDAIYSACEGWCSIPMGDEEPGGALAVTSHFFEFMDEETVARGGTQTRFAWELEDNRRYYILFTTSAGLSRYMLGDIVETCGFFGRIPRIRFVRKGGAAANVAGEKLEEVHANEAVAAAFAKTGVTATFFTLAPDWSGPVPGYTLHLEPAPECASAPQAHFDALALEVDAGLARVSYDYGRLRGSNQLSPVKLRRIPVGRYEEVRQSRVADGSAEAQLKTAHLTADVATLPEPLRRD
jgi:hypothetical protein